jgi:hypothetical protein
MEFFTQTFPVTMPFLKAGKRAELSAKKNLQGGQWQDITGTYNGNFL